MTLEELRQHLVDTFYGEVMTRDTLTRMEYYATVMSKELYPEVDHVMVKSVFTDDDLRPIDISFAFRSEQDALWFKLKYA